DDEIAGSSWLDDSVHLLLGRQRVPVLIVVLIVPRTSVFRLVRKGRRAYQHGQRERRHPFEHYLGLPADGGGRIEAIFSAAKGTQRGLIDVANAKPGRARSWCQFCGMYQRHPLASHLMLVISIILEALVAIIAIF